MLIEVLVAVFIAVLVAAFEPLLIEVLVAVFTASFGTTHAGQAQPCCSVG